MPPSQAELQAWADDYAETFPVVSDGDRYIHTFGKKGGEVKLPSYTLIGPGMEILIADGPVPVEDIVLALPLP